MEMEQRILEVSKGLFYRFGIKSVTMDDIARELGMSKKTIYQYFNDKDSIVCEIMKAHMETEANEIDEITKTAIDPIDELVQISIKLRQHMQMMNPSLLFDLSRYHPNAMRMFSEFMDDCVLCSVKENLDKGKELGLYRNDIDTEIISKLRVKEAEIAFDGVSFPPSEFEIPKVQIQFFDHFLYGIVSEKGYQLLIKYFKKINQAKNEKAA